VGFKAPLAYSSSFYFVCRKDGMERKYMMYEGEDLNTIDLLYETPTEERNGVKVIIPVKYSDRYSFNKKIKEQLCYFEDVYFDIPSDSSITNDFTIVRHEHFQFSELSTDTKLHICLDNVYYPLDFDKIGIKVINFPVALRFNLTDGLYPTPNREALRYTQEAKEVIKEKLEIISDYFINKYNESVEEGMNIGAMIQYIENSTLSIKFNEHSYNIESFRQFSKTQVKIPVLSGVNHLSFASLYKARRSFILDGICTLKFNLKNDRLSDSSKSGHSWRYNLLDITANPNVTVYFYQDRISGVMKDYIKTISNKSHDVFFVKFKNPMELGHRSKYNINTYYHLLELNKYPKSEWREIIKEYQFIKECITEKMINLDKIVIPQSYIDSRKKVKILSNGSQQAVGRKQKLKGEIIGKRAEDLQKWSDGRTCKFVPITYKLEDLDNSKHLKIYAHHDDYLKLDALYGLVSKQKIEIVTFSQREINIIKDLKIHNLITLETFMEGKTAPFKRMVTAYFIKTLMTKYRFVFERTLQVGYTSIGLRSKLDKLSKYASDNYVIPGYSGGSGQSKEFLDSMLVVAEENKLFDMNIYPEAVEVDEILTKLAFLNTLCQQVGYYNEEAPMVGVMTDLFKYYKHKVDLKHYNIRVNEEVITEEQIEQLIN